MEGIIAAEKEVVWFRGDGKSVHLLFNEMSTIPTGGVRWLEKESVLGSLERYKQESVPQNKEYISKGPHYQRGSRDMNKATRHKGTKKISYTEIDIVVPLWSLRLSAR